jgi:hypothetical protein
LNLNVGVAHKKKTFDLQCSGRCSQQ